MKYLSSGKLFLLMALILGHLCSCAHDEGLVICSPPYSQRYNTEVFSDDADYILIIGDVQEYTAKSSVLPYFTCSMLWSSNQIEKGAPVKGMLFTGDLTDGNKPKQWKVFQDNLNLISDLIPVVTVPGNHDYTWNRGENNNYSAIRDRRTCHLTTYASSKLLHDRIIDAFHPDSLDNIVVSFEINGKPIDVMALEFGPRPEVLDWAAHHISSNPDRRYIILTHELLTRQGKLIENNEFSHSQNQFAPFGLPYSTPRQVFDKLAYPHPNVIAMLCGHNGFSAFNETQKNSVGNPVPIILFNLQYLANGGNGLIEIWEFPHDSNQVNIKIVDTLHNTLLHASTGDFTYGDSNSITDPSTCPTTFSFTYP